MIGIENLPFVHFSSGLSNTASGWEQYSRANVSDLLKGAMIVFDRAFTLLTQRAIHPVFLDRPPLPTPRVLVRATF